MDLTEELRVGTRALEGEEGFDLDEELRAFPDLDVWALSCTLSVDVPADSPVPATTSWWVQVAPTYPAGRLELYPANHGGITQTFPHQSFNGEGRSELPWRSGNLCLRTDIGPLRRDESADEPFTAARRLVWNVGRARRWLELAAREQLLREGDPFELPDFRFGGGGRLAFAETPARWQQWKDCAADCGFVQLQRMEVGQPVLVVARFEDSAGQPVVEPQSWGRMVREQASTAVRGVWLRVPDVPKVPPWQAPATWSELKRVLADQGCEVSSLLPKLLDVLRHAGEDSPSAPPLLVGFPIPAVVGQPPVSMHWIGFELPILARGNDVPNGFRPNRKGWYLRDEQRLGRRDRLPWYESQSWSDDDLTGRGRVPDELRAARVVLIGAGGLGSAVGELLARGGVRSLLVFDGETLEAGNLVRHTLTLGDVGANKAEALARHLEGVSPHLEVEAVAGVFPEVPEEHQPFVQRADLVIDTTADDALLVELERYAWEPPRVFVSLCLGVHGRRSYAFAVRSSSFPRQEYVDWIAPFLEEAWKGVDPALWPREGLGCWDPLLPVRGTRVTLLAALAVEWLGEILQRGLADSKPVLEVMEIQESEGRFRGVQRRTGQR